MDFAERLRDLRMEKHMTLDELGKAVGVGRATIYKYEHGVITNIPVDRITRIANALGVSRPYLLGWSDDREKTMGDVSVLSDSSTFVKAYSAMNAGERKTISDILIIAYGRYMAEHKE